MANLKHKNSSRCINFIEYKQLATVRFNCEQHKMLIAECVSTSKRREHGLLSQSICSNLRSLTVATSIEKIITNTTTAAIRWPLWKMNILTSKSMKFVPTLYFYCFPYSYCAYFTFLVFFFRVRTHFHFQLSHNITEPTHGVSLSVFGSVWNTLTCAYQ